MKVRSLVSVLCLALFLPFFCEGTDSEQKTQNTALISEATPNSPQATDTKNATSSSQSASTHDDDFKKVPQKTVYGPVGIVLKTVEFVLNKLYILYEW